MTAQEWWRHVRGLSPSVPEDDPVRETARRMQATAPPESWREPGPSGIDWENDREAVGEELRRLREASRPFVVKLAPEAGPAPKREPGPVPPKILGYVAVADHDGVLGPVGPVTPLRAQAEGDAVWWRANDSVHAFVAELREAGR